MLRNILACSEPSLCYLSDISPKDGRFDRYKRFSEEIKEYYYGTEFSRYWERIDGCAGSLGFGLFPNPITREMSFKLVKAHFCRVRHCPVCQSRRGLMWSARFRKAIPAILSAYPNVEFIFLTLTLRNVPIGELRETIEGMNRAWKRLIQRSQFPRLGFVRSLEVTRSRTGAGEAHPHFHCLIVVPRTYFIGRNYIKAAKWAELWRDCLRVSYTPVVHVRKVRPEKGIDDPIEALTAGLQETVKYTVKPEDLIADRDWLIELTRQLQKVRAISLGGIFREFLREDEPEDLVSEDDSTESSEVLLIFDWHNQRHKYKRI